MKKREGAGETNDINYFVFNCYHFIYRFAFDCAFDNSR